MSDRPSRLSQEAVERLIARAVELEDENDRMIDLARAREIAQELGIDHAAWQAALREDAASRSSPSKVALTARGWWHAGAATVGGLAMREALYRSQHDAQASIAGWWSGSAAGIMLGLGHATGDIVWFAALSWLGSAAVGAVLPGFVRRARRPPEAAATST